MPPEIVSLQHTAALWAFVLSFVFGAVTQRSNYCTMGAISDIANFGDWTRARMAIASVGVAIIGVALLKFTGTVDIAKSFYVAPKLVWLSNIVGGLCFGFGMTLAGGCGSKTLLRVGSGSLRALVTILVMAVFAWFTLRGILGVFRVATFDAVALTLPSTQDLPSLMSLSGAIGVDPGGGDWRRVGGVCVCRQAVSRRQMELDRGHRRRLDGDCGLVCVGPRGLHRGAS